jgi:hypothetical protein
MSVPGLNLLGVIRASGKISFQSFEYLKFNSRASDSAGRLVSDYDAPLSLLGSVQPLSSKELRDMGLDYKQRYIKIYVESPVLDYQRDTSGDLVNYGGDTWTVVTINDWYGQDGWREIVAQKKLP